MDTALRPFEIAVEDAVLDDLRLRLARTRWPGEAEAAGWAYGANLDYMQRLIAYWRDDYDWRARESELNRFPQVTTEVALDDGTPLRLHAIHERADDAAAPAIIVSHGWPGSTMELMDLIERLAHPDRFGRPGPAFHVIAPSLPGYGFSQAPPAPIDPRQIAGLWRRLMQDNLGYPRFFAQGGDWGAIITAWLGFDHGDAAAAVHMNMAPLRPDFGRDDLDDDERAWLDEVMERRRLETAYQQVHATRPQSIAYGLTDSPVGLAGWIAEKFHAWSNDTLPEPPFTMDQILTNVMIYWVTGCMNSSMWLYRAVFLEGRGFRLRPGQRIAVPCSFCLPPHDLSPPPPDTWLHRIAENPRIARLADGGHFTALQVPDALGDDVRDFFAGQI